MIGIGATLPVQPAMPGAPRKGDEDGGFAGVLDKGAQGRGEAGRPGGQPASDAEGGSSVPRTAIAGVDPFALRQLSRLLAGENEDGAEPSDAGGIEDPDDSQAEGTKEKDDERGVITAGMVAPTDNSVRAATMPRSGAARDEPPEGTAREQPRSSGGEAQAEDARDDARNTTSGRRNTAPDSSNLRVQVVAEANSVAPVTPTQPKTAIGLVDAMANDAEWRGFAASAEATADDRQPSNPAPVRDLRIQLNPERLGEVNARLRLVGDQLSVEIKVDNAEAHRVLSSDRDAIISSLRALGLRVDEVVIQQQPASQAQSGTAQNGSGGSAWQASSGSGRGDGEGGNEGNGARGQQNETGTRDDARNASGDAGRGGLYI